MPQPSLLTLYLPHHSIERIICHMTIYKCQLHVYMPGMGYNVIGQSITWSQVIVIVIMTFRCNVIVIIIDYICNIIVIRDYFHDYNKVFNYNLIVKATTIYYITCTHRFSYVVFIYVDLCLDSKHCVWNICLFVNYIYIWPCVKWVKCFYLSNFVNM